MTTTDSPPLFDRLRYIDRLTAAGIAEDQARAHADAMQDALREGVATKNDINDLRTAMKSDFAAVRSELQAVEYRLTVRGGLVAAAVVAILASLKFFG